MLTPHNRSWSARDMAHHLSNLDAVLSVGRDKVVYVDVEFVAQKCEEIKDIPAQSVLTRTEGGQAGLKALFMHAAVHTQESRTYPMSSVKMLGEVFDTLKERYRNIDLEAWENGKGSRIGWIHGNLTVGAWRSSSAGQDQDPHKYYELYSSDKRVSLLPNSAYFYPGFSDLLNLSEALKRNIGIPVAMLVRVLYYAEVSKTFVAVPFLGFEVDSEKKE